MKKCFIFLSLFFILALFATWLSAQVPSRPSHIAEGTIEKPNATLENLSNDYFSGRWDNLQEKATKILEGHQIEGYKIDAKTNFYFIILLSQEKDEDPRLIRFLWHDPKPEPYVSWIPGLTEIYEIILSENSELALKTSYLSTKLEDPFLPQIPKFLKIIEPILAGLKAVEPSGVPPINVEIRKIVLPHKRAKIKIVDVANLNSAALSNKIKSAARELAKKLNLRTAYQSDYGKNITCAICSSMNKVNENDDKMSMLKKFWDSVNMAYSSIIDNSTPKPEELKLAITIEEEFLGMIKESIPKDVKAENECINIPPVRFSFSLMSARAIQNDFTRKRMKVADSGVYAADPLSGLIMAAILNYHPKKYDPQSSQMQKNEKYRLFVGGVLSPEIGICAGAGLAIIRGIALNGGVALLSIHTKNAPDNVLVDGLEFEKPHNPIEPFKRKWGSVLFIGLGYSFQ